MNIAVVGATGVVGETIIRVLRERKVPIDELGLFASRARNGVQATSDEALAPFQAVFFAGSEEASEKFAPAILARGGVVIDNSSTYRMRPEVPLLIPEINAHALKPENRLLPVGNCTAIILCMALAPIRNVAGLTSVSVASYQAVSGAGREALDEFDAGKGPIIGNVIPQIGGFDDSGNTGEEVKVIEETRKILELPDLAISVTAVRVPVRTAHSEVVFFETERDASLEQLDGAFGDVAGVLFHKTGIVTPRDVEGTDVVHVARLRARPGAENRFAMWVVGDQLRKGAATNAVQILELLLERGML